MATKKPTIAVYKFSSCDGCQLGILNLEDELLDLVGMVEIAHFLEARRQVLPGPYDIGLVEGSISTPRRNGTDQRDPPAVRYSDRSGHLRHRRRCAGPAQL